MHIYRYIPMYVCMYAYMYLYMCVYVCVHIIRCMRTVQQDAYRVIHTDVCSTPCVWGGGPMINI